MLIFASSDKGGTGRSVTSCNIAYQLSLKGLDVAYLDFDFGSPTAGAIFEVEAVERGTDRGGLHSHIVQQTAEPHRVDVRVETARPALKIRPPKSGSLILYPGDRNGAEFAMDEKHATRAAALFRRMDSEFDAVVVDLSSGRSQAVEMSLRALALPALRKKSTVVRWLVFHRWTRQHVLAANGLVYDDRGILDIAQDAGHDRAEFLNLIRSIRTAVPDLNAPSSADRAPQARWLRSCNDELKTLARSRLLGQNMLLGETPLEPMLLWREQVIMEADVNQLIANRATVAAFTDLAHKISDNRAWEGL